MRLLIFFADEFICSPTIKTLDEFPVVSTPIELKDAVLAFIHVEPKDFTNKNKTVTKMLKHIKWVANKIGTKNIVLHSFAHLAEMKADPIQSYEIFKAAYNRLENSDYEPVITPYGYFNDLEMKLPGKPIARIFKEF